MGCAGFLAVLTAAVSIVTTDAMASVFQRPETASFAIEVEGQALWQGRNDAAVPGNTGSRFSLRDVLGSPVAGYRVEPTWFISQKHQLRGVFAPLTLEGSGKLAAPVAFQNATFNAAADIEATFKFNSYRLTYRYAFVDAQDWLVLAGFTAKVRDATIGLRQGAVFQEKTNVGFVPLLHGAVAYRFAQDWQAELEVDALAAPQGRAEDVRAGVRKRFPGPRLSVALGYRILEGGADNDQVFTFALFHYGVASLGYEF